MRFRVVLSAVLLVVLPGLSSATAAQQTKVLTLDEILERLEANLKHYDSSLPSLFCDEHIVSRMKPGVGEGDTVTDSTFRVKRSETPDHTTSLAESREFRTVNGKPASSQLMTEFPSLVGGAFAGGFGVVSQSQKACMRYTLEPIRGSHLNELYVVDFATALTPENKVECRLQETSKGRVFIDPASMQITHLEMTAPRHVVLSAEAHGWPVIGKWVLTIEYAPVVLEGETFWMPSEITSRNTSTEGSYLRTTWSFQATYTNYHRLEVKSRILPAGETVAR